jgi:hypothetical protein
VVVKCPGVRLVSRGHLHGKVTAVDVGEGIDTGSSPLVASIEPTPHRATKDGESRRDSGIVKAEQHQRKSEPGEREEHRKQTAQSAMNALSREASTATVSLLPNVVRFRE